MKSIFFIAFACFSCIIVSCKKQKRCSAGTGGDITLIASPKHHILPIFSKVPYLDTIYLKFNTSESPGPGTSDYDIFFVGTVGTSNVRCEGLKCGDYYILATGFDSTIDARVFGGLPITLSEGENEKSIDVPVVE